jgi:cytochrome b involved in lipid metabolism
LTSYANCHPGGARVMTNLAGTDGASEYWRFHLQGLLSNLSSNTLVGRVLLMLGRWSRKVTPRMRKTVMTRVEWCIPLRQQLTCLCSSFCSNQFQNCK